MSDSDVTTLWILSQSTNTLITWPLRSNKARSKFQVSLDQKNQRHRSNIVGLLFKSLSPRTIGSSAVIFAKHLIGWNALIAIQCSKSELHFLTKECCTYSFERLCYRSMPENNSRENFIVSSWRMRSRQKSVVADSIGQLKFYLSVIDFTLLVI